MATLVEEIRNIEKLPEGAAVDKLAAYRNTLRDRSERSYLVRRFVTGQNSPSQEIEKLVKRVGGWRAFIPVYLTDEDKNHIKELEPIVEGMHRDSSSRFMSLLANPVGVASAASLAYAIIFPALSYAYALDPGNHMHVSPQEAAMFGAVTGAVIGGLVSYLKLLDIRHVRESGRYLESKIREVGGI